MFKRNDDHFQEELFSHYSTLRPSVAKLLEKSWAAVFYEQVFCKINEELFAPLYSDVGRPNFPVNRLLSLEIIKNLFDYTDLEILDQFHFNYQVIYALGIKNFGEVSLAERTIYEFRERIFNYIKEKPDQEYILFQQFETLTKNFIELAGIKTNEQRIDSTLISPNIKKAGRLSLAHDVLNQAVSAIPQQYLSERLNAVLDSSFRTNLLFHTRNRELDSRLQIVLDLMADVEKLSKEHREIATLEEFKILKRFLHEQAYYSPKDQCYLPRDKKEVKSSSLQSAYDTEATFREKAGKKSSGYVLSISETCSDENPVQLITDYNTKPNNTSDVELINDRLPTIKKNTNIEELYTDGGFYSEEVIENAQELGINLHFTDMTGRKPPENQIPLTSFTFKEQMIVTECPNGQKPLCSDYSEKKKSSTTHFALDVCKNCPLRPNCPVKQQKKSFVLRITKKAYTAAIARKELLDLKIKKENTSKRAAIEGTNSALKRAQGADKLRTRGQIRCSMEITFKIIARNFKQFWRGITKRALPKRKPVPKGSVSPLPA